MIAAKSQIRALALAILAPLSFAFAQPRPMLSRPLPPEEASLGVQTFGPAPLPWRGADVSSFPQIESAGGVYKLGALPTDPLVAMRSAGLNLVRLRVWHTPAGGWCGTSQTLALAQRAHAAGLATMLCIHYSDTWADPGQQSIPAAWQGMSDATLAQAVESYTRALVEAMDAQGTPARLVQVGNETTDGMLWPSGRISERGWDPFVTLLNAGIRGVRTANLSSPPPNILIHIDRGGDNATSRWYFDALTARNVDFDAIALSYYPWWHGPLAAMSANVTDLAARYAKPVMIVETAYPFTLSWNDNTNNIIGTPSQLAAGYAASIGGQGAFLGGVSNAVRAIPNARGLGVCAWGAELISAPGLGSSWENAALFDFQGNLLTSARAIR